MPKFAPNTGFKMPGVGSKEIDSPGNFRDEHHVDKMGYCDNTPDDMLPEGSSPLKARYTTTGYRKDLDVIDAVNLSSPKEKDDDDEKTSSGGGNAGGNGGNNTSTKRSTTNFSDKIEIDPIKVKQPTFTDLSPPSSKSEVPVSKPKKYTDAMAFKNLGEAGIKKYGKGKKGLDAFSTEASAYRKKHGTGTNVAKKGGLRDAAKSTSGTAGAKTGQAVSDAAEKIKDLFKKK